jgi:serine phosphatase RsbU (regulator of sigma subunit)
MADRLVLFALANLTAQAASRARLLVEQTLALRSIEQAFEPRLDTVEGIRTSHLYRAATVASASGGDWYDLIGLGHTSLIAIGDVANHGAVAVGEMVRARATVHALAHQGLGPAEIATQASAVLSKLASTFTTCVVAILDHRSLELEWTTAGHPFPILVRADGSIDTLTPTCGPPLGAGIDHPYESHRRRLAPGDTLVLYTDGLIERPTKTLDGGFDALRAVLPELNLTTPDLASRLFRALHEAERHRDDVAILTVRILDTGIAGSD